MVRISAECGKDSRNISTALKEVAPMIEITPQELDVDEFLLNTPKDTIMLKTGKVQGYLKSTEHLQEKGFLMPGE